MPVFFYRENDSICHTIADYKIVMSMDTFSPSRTAIEFKSASLSVPVLILADNDLLGISQQLRGKIAQAPEFFKNSPVLIDFQKLTSQNLELSVAAIVGLLREYNFMPIGIRGGTDKQNAESLTMSLPVHTASTQSSGQSEKKTSSKKLLAPEQQSVVINNPPVENKLITQPIRSGQRVYAKGDLIVTATVSAGAEILAEGNIHIYGSLRGRALAGVLGNTESRIFCSDLQAELISIAGIYQLRDDLSQHAAHIPLQISLENQKLIIKQI